MPIEKNKVVTIEYTLRDPETKEIIDQSPEGKPLMFITGAGNIIPGLEKAILEMDCGETKEILVKAEEAYGLKNEDAYQTVSKSDLQHIPDLKEGMVLYGQNAQGQQVQVVVSKIDDQKVTLDFNHPLAGKDLLFEVKICDVRDATEEELAHGHVHAGEHNCGCGSDCGCKH